MGNPCEGMNEHDGALMNIYRMMQDIAVERNIRKMIKQVNILNMFLREFYKKKNRKKLKDELKCWREPNKKSVNNLPGTKGIKRLDISFENKKKKFLESCLLRPSMINLPYDYSQ